MAMGERTPLAVAGRSPASGRMAVAEALTNLAAATIARLSRHQAVRQLDGRLRWKPGQDAALYDTVKAVGLDLCPALGIGIPVGKDSLSMRTSLGTGRRTCDQQVTVAPVSLIVTAFAPVDDVRAQSLTPQLRTDAGDTCW